MARRLSRETESKKTRGDEMSILKGKRVLVTGASSGIGREIALRFSREGAAVAVGGRNVERVEETCRLITDTGGRAVPAVGDVALVKDAERVVQIAADELDGLDTVVNNAGIDTSEWHDVAEWPVDQFDAIMAVNVRGPFLVAKFAIPHLLKAGGGSMLH